MGKTTRFLLFLTISALLIFNVVSSTEEAKKEEEDLDEDLKFLLETEGDKEETHDHHHGHHDHGESSGDEGEDDFENYDDFEDSVDPDAAATDEDPFKVDADEKDVVVLKQGNFSEFIEKNKYVMVEFYAPWCGHCQSLAPEYATAATELKDEGVVLAKVDATEENELAQKYNVEGFPTVFFFVDGVHKSYPGQRTKEGIVSWIKKKTGPGVKNVTTVEEAETILAAEEKLVLGFFDSLVGSDSNELSSASKLEDDVNFYQTNNPDAAKVFHIDPKAKRPALVLLKKEAEKISNYNGKFTTAAISEFVFENKLPLVNNFTRETAPMIFENPIKNQVLLFAASKDAEKYLPALQEAAKLFKGKLIFVYVEMDNEDVGKPVSDYFGVSGDGPKVLAYTGNEDGKKFFLDGEVTQASIKAFGEDFLADKLKPFFKSDPIPETNDGDVKIVVGDNFDAVVLDESKDVLLEIYAPWCGHCQTLEPIYNKLAKHLRGIDSLVIAKMDGTTNEHPRAKSDGFPTILFFPAGNKSFDPLTVEVDRTVVAFYKYIKKHASIPFKLQKPEAAPAASKTTESSTKDVKDEL
ncbi:hypothetical protein MKW98_026682 [Papaver atlanticum]|uniref:Protein disulfide-isomerase n=1 Tax=Papaver atlanticum TaxID=357466 RepID=A0AAD4X5D6_9MAGN|nr:hypothetical protein MKW98_026682 [Papaver atlanticum]